jgi:hypothetical protein
MVGASFTVAAVAQVLRSKKGITAVGNAQIDTAQSKFGGASLLLDGTGDYLSSTTPISLGTGDWTVELWLRTGTANRVFFDNRIPTASAGVFFLSASGFASYYDNTTGTISGTTNCADSTFRHLAFSKSGTTLRIFVNGTVEYTATGYTQDMGTDRSCIIGAQFDGAISINGHIDEFRISNTARYTANFLAPNTPFVNDANTLFLMHANGTDAATFFEDDNGAREQKGITAIGNAQVDTAQSKFGGASALFDGTGDYLLVENLAGNITGDFTFECWVRFNSLPASNSFHMFVTGDGNRYFALLNNSGTYRWESSLMTGSNQYVARYTPSITTGVWYHIALIKSGSTLTFYQDGTSYAGSTIAGSMTSTSTLFVSGTNILGAYTSANYSLNGWLDEIRVSNSVRYTTTFTPSTTPFTNDANTLLLVHADGTDASTVFRDDNGIIGSTPKAITAVGNAQISTAQSKFGGSSALFDGTGDYLSIADTADFGFTADFTIEFWVRGTTLNEYNVLYSNFNFAFSGLYFAYWHNATKFSIFINGSERVSASTTLSTNTWYHISLVRSGSTVTVYRDGTSIGTGTYSGTVATPVITAIGINTDGFQHGWTGYIDEIRVSNIARYTASFTPATTAFTQDSNTLLLIHADGANASTTFRDDAGRTQKGISAIGNAQVDTAQSKFGGASALFDGNTDKLTIDSQVLPLTGDWTIECWFRASTLGTQNNLWYAGPNGHTPYFYSSGVTWYDWDSNLNVSTTISTNTWYHFVCEKQGSTRRMYLNGSVIGTASTGDRTTSYLWIGAHDFDTAKHWNGHIDEFRVSNTARYQGIAFTPSTTPFQSDASTLLLIHADGSDGSTVFTDDNGLAPITGTRIQNNIIVSRNAQISTAQSKFGGSSAYFDGAYNDASMLRVNGPNVNFTNQNFTIECWVRFNDVTTTAGNKYFLSSADDTTTSFLIASQTISGVRRFRVTIVDSTGSLIANNWTISDITPQVDTWYHVAVTRSGSTFRGFVDGTEASSTITSSASIFSKDYLCIGGLIEGTTAMLNGYIDEVRVSNTARYTAGFTPSTTAFTNDANTLLLIHADGANTSKAFTDDNA